MFRNITGRIMRKPEDGTGSQTTTETSDSTQTAHPVTAPWGSTDTWQLGEAGKEQPWYMAIPEESVRESVKAKGYKNPAEVAMAYHSLMGMQRNPDNVIVPPGADATPEQLNEFYTKLGRPEAADKYDLKMPDGVTPDPRMVTFARDVSFELGLNPSQAQKLADKWNEFAPQLGAQVEEQERVQNDKDIAELQTSWGADLDANKAAGRRAMDALGLDAADVDKIDKAVGTAAVVKLLAAIGKKSAEGSFVTPTNNGDPNDPASMSKDQAQARINQLSSDVAFQSKYTDKAHPEHTWAVKHMEALYAKS